MNLYDYYIIREGEFVRFSASQDRGKWEEVVHTYKASGFLDAAKKFDEIKGQFGRTPYEYQGGI